MQEKRSLVGLAHACAAVALLTGATPGVGMTTERSHSVIALHCPQDVTQPDALCQSMVKALTRRSPTSDVQRLTGDEELQLGAGDLRVAVHVDGMTETTLSAHLEWRVGDNDRVTTGPQIEFTVMDTTLRPALFDQFADGLLAASPALLERLP